MSEKFKISNLDLYYGDFHALKDINMSIEANEITAFIGPSGCGKSTFLKSLNRMNDLVEGCKITGNVLLDGGEAHCFMADEEVAKIAKERGVTRATVSMEKASQIQKPVIFAIGNAPTALIELYQMIQSGSYRPAFIIGVPVGFVNVEAAKELILKTDIPYIINRGRKGGSNVAAAICNALLYELRDEM